MNFYDVSVQDPVIGHVALSNVWPHEEFVKLSQVYDRAKAFFIETMKAVPPSASGP
jgi:hypothetical protein